MIAKPLDDITKADIDALLANKVKEVRNIEYKKILTVANDEQKKEFLSDVASFATVSGGDLIFGVEAMEGIPIAAQGIAVASEDQEELRLSAMIKDGLDPRIVGVRLKFVPGFPDGMVLIIRIPKSWNAPHMVKYKNSSRFYTRTGAGRHQMDSTEIRSAFALTADLPERIRRFRDERIGNFLAGESPVSRTDRPTMMLHLIPLSSFSASTVVDIQKANSNGENFPPLGTNGHGPRYNADGLLRFGGIGNEIIEYCQLFRSGRIESVDSELAKEYAGNLMIPSVKYESDILHATRCYLKGLKIAEVPPPFVLLLTIINAKKALMGLGSSHMFRHGSGQGIDRDIVLLPDVMILEFEQSLDATLRPVFDAVWNACGYPKTLNYNDKGEWIGH